MQNHHWLRHWAMASVVSNFQLGGKSNGPYSGYRTGSSLVILLLKVSKLFQCHRLVCSVHLLTAYNNRMGLFHLAWYRFSNVTCIWCSRRRVCANGLWYFKFWSMGTNFGVTELYIREPSFSSLVIACKRQRKSKVTTKSSVHYCCPVYRFLFNIIVILFKEIASLSC